MTVTRSLVSVVDDDESVRESLPDLLNEFGFAARAFSSPEEFLASGCLPQTKCLLLDIAMPGMSGPDLQRELKRRGHADSDYLYHCQHGQDCSPTTTRTGCGGMPVQALQRHVSA